MLRTEQLPALVTSRRQTECRQQRGGSASLADELRLLRRALAGNVDALKFRERVAALVRTVAGTNVVEPPAPSKSSKSTPARKVITSSSAPAQSKSAPTRSGPPTKRKKKSKKSNGPNLAAKGQATVYVTTWGHVVHLFHDCHSVRGFRDTNEPDPDLYRVPVNDPSCRGRRVCGTCRNVTFANAKKIEEQLRRFHGKPFDEAEWQRRGMVPTEAQRQADRARERLTAIESTGSAGPFHVIRVGEVRYVGRQRGGGVVTSLAYSDPHSTSRVP